MAALFGVLSVVNVYTGTMFDIIFIYLMTVALAYYTFKFNAKMAVLVLFTSTFILFLTGELFFTLYSFFTFILTYSSSHLFKNNSRGTLTIAITKNWESPMALAYPNNPCACCLYTNVLSTSVANPGPPLVVAITKLNTLKPPNTFKITTIVKAGFNCGNLIR